MYELLSFSVGKNLSDLNNKIMQIFNGLDNKTQNEILNQSQNYLKTLVGSPIMPVSDIIIEKALNI